MDNFDNEESEVDNGVLPFVKNDESEESEEIETRVEDNQPGEGENPEPGEGELDENGNPIVRTEKGTKLDPNPQSQVHQQLANERRIRENYERVLGDPEALRKYAKEAGMTLEEAKAEIKDDAKKFSPDRFKTAQDIADVLNELQGGLETTIKEIKAENQRLRGELSGISSSRQVERVATTMQSDIGSIQEKYPQLNPKSPDYDPALEKEIGSFYHELDAVDPNDPSKGYRGQFSLAKITERFMRVRGEGAKRGSQQAQTTVKTKIAGKVVTSSRSDSKDTQVSSAPGTSIAQKVARALKNS